MADTTYNGYCVKCKEKRDFQGTVEVSKTGMNMAKGKCPVCGTTVNRILGKAEGLTLCPWAGAAGNGRPCPLRPPVRGVTRGRSQHVE